MINKYGNIYTIIKCLKICYLFNFIYFFFLITVLLEYL